MGIQLSEAFDHKHGGVKGLMSPGSRGSGNFN